MTKSIRIRSMSIAVMAVASISIAGWAMAQRGDAKSDDKSQPQGRGWAGQTDQGLLDQIAADGIMQMNKGQIELANFALKHTQNENVRRFAQTSIENCTRLNNELEKFVADKNAKDDVNRDRSTATEDRSAQRNEQSDPSVKHDNEATSRGWASNWNSQNLNVIRHDISNQVVASVERELAQYQGMDFDRAFLGQQFWGHVTIAAMAKASGKQVSGDLRKLLTEAATDAEKQLESCRTLIRDLPSPVARTPDTTPRR
jgi:predicted outer membrane protein